MDVTREVIRILDDVLSLGGRSAAYTRETPLLGAVAELDSMAVVALLTTIEERFGVTVRDDEVDGRCFATVGSLSAFVGGLLESPST